jgi:hypothetical protein
MVLAMLACAEVMAAFCVTTALEASADCCGLFTVAAPC